MCTARCRQYIRNAFIMLQPVGDHVLVKPLSKEEKTKGGIILPDAAQQERQEGTVVAVGHGKYFGEKLVTFEEMGVKPNALIMFERGYGTSKLKVDDEEFMLISFESIIGVITQ